MLFYFLPSFGCSKYISDLIPSPNNDNVFPSDVVDSADPINTWPPPPPRSSLEDEEPPRSPKRQIMQDASECPRSPKSPRHVPRSPNSPRHVPCMTDIGTLVRRVRNVRIAFAPETCV